MLKTWFSTYKWYAVAVLFLVYSVGVWNVSADVRENEYNKEKLELSNQIVKLQEENLRLNTEVSTALRVALAKQSTIQSKDIKDLKDALSKSTVYMSCRNTDSVQQLYKRKLQTQ